MKGIVLVGFMATGKTQVAKELAQRLQWRFWDTDDLIVQAAGKSIPRIFAEDGEPAFREQETKVLEKLSLDEPGPAIVATGGGIVLAEDNWLFLRRLGTVICLTARPEEILKRAQTGEVRPLLGPEPAQALKRIEDLLAQRRTAYAKTDWTLATDGLTVPASVQAILQWLAKENLLPAP
jgi:shikimate kinase